jgi:hypothetical protein
MRNAVIGGLLWGSALIASPARAQSADAAATPEMARLARALAGDWTTEETVQYGKPVPAGSGRHGTSRVRLAGGGTVLVSEGRSAGAVGGELRWFITIWWEPASKQYRFLTCFQTPGDSGCELRGTGHWEGETLVNDYEEVFHGKRTKMQDRWTDITPRSHTLTALVDSGNGAMTPYVVSRSTRQGGG